MTENPSRLPYDWPNRAFSQSIRIGKIEWHVQISGTGPVVLLLHGTGASAHSWAEVIPELAKVSTVVAPDLPGHGFTRGAKIASLTLPQIAAELDALIDALKISSPVLVVGHSAGAPLGLRWALNTPRRPQALIGFNPSLVGPPAVYTRLFAPFIVPLATSPIVANIVATLGARTRMVDRLLDSTRSKLSLLQRARYATLFNDPSHVRGAMGFMAAADLPAIMASAATLDVATTFVLGSKDEWIPERPVCVVMSRYFPGAKILQWDGGHVLHEEFPGEAAALVLETLKSLSLDAPT